MYKICIDHPQVGLVEVTYKASCRRVIGRWRNGIVNLSVPERYSRAQIDHALATLAPRLLRMKPQIRFEVPSDIVLDGLTIHIDRHRFIDRMGCRIDLPECHLLLPERVDVEDLQGALEINRCLCVIARKVAPRMLIPRAEEISRKLGVAPGRWRISSSFRALGTCNSKSEISLSYYLVFLPQELRDYIVCHELAHLTHLNHSPAFHELLNSYLGGREQLLRHRLNAYHWPILRK